MYIAACRGGVMLCFGLGRYSIDNN